jgi:hypothetical protein
MLDWLRDDLEYVDDLKTTSDASPRGFQRKVWNLRHDIQAAFYRRAVLTAYDTQPRFRWIAVETEYPYLVTVHEPSKLALENADARIDEAIDRWREACETGVFAGYTPISEVGPVPWEQDKWATVEIDEVPF